jgi:hypothetical protein
MVRAPRGARGRLSARHMRSSSCGKRMLICGDYSIGRAPLSPFGPALTPLERRHALVWTLGSSASSWQGLIVVPGGAPAPPECRNATPARRAPHPVPPHDASRLTPLSGRGECRISAVQRDGGKWCTVHTSPIVLASPRRPEDSGLPTGTCQSNPSGWSCGDRIDAITAFCAYGALSHL